MDVGAGDDVAPDIVVAADLLVVDTGVALSSFRLASSVINSAKYSEQTTKENHGGRDVSSRSA